MSRALAHPVPVRTASADDAANIGHVRIGLLDSVLQIYFALHYLMLTLTLGVGVNGVNKGYQRCRGLFAQLACTNNDTRMLSVALSRFRTRRNGKMRTTITIAALAVALFAAPAVAQTTTTVGSTSQLGSVLIFPHVPVTTGTDTFIEISNHSAGPINLECSYINEKKGRVDFSFAISGNGTVSWDVGTRAGDGLAVPVFPTGGNFGPPGFAATSADLGELVCFAVDPTYNYQVEFNHLYGTATVLDLAVTGTGAQPKQGFKYNAWSLPGRMTAMAVLPTTTMSSEQAAISR